MTRTALFKINSRLHLNEQLLIATREDLFAIDILYDGKD